MAQIFEELTNRWLDLKSKKEYGLAVEKFDSSARRIITSASHDLYWTIESKLDLSSFNCL